MSDYMFMLENHLAPEQNRVVAYVQAAATAADARVYLVGGAMRDMLGAFPIRDLDFALEGAALKVAKAVAQSGGAEIISVDEHRKSAELVFPGGVTTEIAMTRQEKYARTGGRPQVTSASIQDDLRRRDFSINAIALSLNRASRGLLLDPTNGLADLHGKELRALHNYSFYDEPVRLLRLVRFRVRLGFTVEDRTQQQFENARLAEVQKLIPARALLHELRAVANETAVLEVVRALEHERLLGVMAPAFATGKIDTAALSRLEKSIHIVEGAGLRGDWFGPFLYVLTEKLGTREKTALAKGLSMSQEEVDVWQKLEARTRKLETELKSEKLRKPSAVYRLLSKARPDELLFVLYHSGHRTAQDRIRNYLQKYLPAVQEVTPAELAAIEGTPGTPRYEKAKEAMLMARLDRRPKKVEEPPPPPPPPEPPPRGRGRGTIGGLGMRG